MLSRTAFVAAILLAAQAWGQTKQWSAPVTTERWSEAPTPPPSAKEDMQNGRRSTGTRQVDPAWMENPRLVAASAKPPGRMVGRWSLWVPGGVWYSSDGLRVLRNHTAGAALDTLTISGDGSYVWGRQHGQLAEITPWFAQLGERYFEVRMDAQNRYMARYDADTDRLNLFFWGVGGHAARGDRG